MNPKRRMICGIAVLILFVLGMTIHAWAEKPELVHYKGKYLSFYRSTTFSDCFDYNYVNVNEVFQSGEMGYNFSYSRLDTCDYTKSQSGNGFVPYTAIEVTVPPNGKSAHLVIDPANLVDLPDPYSFTSSGSVSGDIDLYFDVSSDNWINYEGHRNINYETYTLFQQGHYAYSYASVEGTFFDLTIEPPEFGPQEGNVGEIDIYERVREK